jgi:hypothetical protein
VSPAELGLIRAPDRVYVAAELTAFLRSWLSALPCPVINRPGTTPSRPELWTRLAVRLGIPVEPIEQRSQAARVWPSSDSTMVVVGHEVFGDIQDPTLAVHARALATASGTNLLRVDFTSGRFRRANPSPELEPLHADALLRFLLGAATEPMAQLRRVAT